MTWENLHADVGSLFAEAEAGPRFDFQQWGSLHTLERVDAIRPVRFICPHCREEHDREAPKRPQGGGKRPIYCSSKCMRAARWARYYKTHGRTRRNRERDNRLARERYAARVASTEKG